LPCEHRDGFPAVRCGASRRKARRRRRSSQGRIGAENDQEIQIMESSGGGLAPLVFLGMFAFVIAGVWRTFTKAGKPGWACLVPIYNIIVMLQIAGRPAWWFVLMFVPIVNIVVAFIIFTDFARAFGKGASFAIGLFFLGFVFYPILGFGDSQYQGAPAR
jgi:hypothetical protein